MPSLSPEILNVISMVLEESWRIFGLWWWIFLPFFIFPTFRDRYRFWIQTNWDATIPKVVLEMKLPKEVIKPIKAMEYVFAGFHAIHDVMTWREVWLEGQFQLAFTIEIVSFGGDVHFYIRCPERFKHTIEANIYAQYAEVEITEVEDYTKNVPLDIPNKEWDVWGTEMIPAKPDYYPIKTYPKFEAEKETIEEKRIDPLAQLLEGMAALKAGEQLWLQLRLAPVLSEKAHLQWLESAMEGRDKLAKRPGKGGRNKPMVQEAFEIFLPGWDPESQKPKEAELIPPEMKLTPGEKDIVQAIEEKLSKVGYNCNIRFLYLSPREVHFRPRVQIPFSFFKSISAQNLNGLKPDKTKQTKVKSVPFWFMDERLLYLKKRRIFRNYVKRWHPIFPKVPRRLKDFYFLNIEELATIFHFPGRIVAPTPSLPRIEVKKGGAPPGLPVE
ncbi:MAG: hypothetical protein AAB565_01425 [Patescibacteria group bacterium]